MRRRPREEEEGGIYHVIQRGNNRAFVFEEDIDKEYLIDQFMLLSKNSCRIYGFVCGRGRFIDTLFLSGYGSFKRSQ